MPTLIRILVLAGLVALPQTAAGQEPPGPPRVNEDAAALQAFNQRLAAYVELHRRLEQELPPLKGAAEATVVDAHQKALARKIRAARSKAKEGDLFDQVIRAWFRRTIARVLADPGARAVVTDTENTPAHVPHPVNGLYPESAPLSTIPPSLLLMLPETPEEVEFRFIGRDLILRDTHADLIVDVIHEALQ